MRNVLIDGDPMEPSPSDIIAQLDRLDAGKPLPAGWNVLDGNMQSSAIGRVVMRWQLENDE